MVQLSLVQVVALRTFRVVIPSSGAREGFGVDSVAIETHNSAMSRMSRVVILEIMVITTWHEHSFSK